MRATFRVLAAATLLACSACETDQERALTHLATARASTASGAHADAVRALEQAVELDPTLRDAWGLLARERAALGRHEGAVAAVRHVTDHDARDREAWRLLAREQLALGAHQDAAAAAEHVLAMPDPSADDAELHARARAGLDDWAGARDSFARAMELDPSRHALLLDVGRAEEHLGRGVDALATYRRAIEADAAGVEPRIRVARLLIQRARGEALGGEDPRLARDEAIQVAARSALLGLLAPAPYEDRHLATRTEAREVLTTAREHLEGEDDPRREAIDAYLGELDALDAESERLRAEAEARVRDAQRSMRSLFGAGGLGGGGLADALRGDSIGDSFGVGGLGLRGTGVGGGGSEGTIGLGRIGTIGHGGGGGGSGYGRGGTASRTVRMAAGREGPLEEPAPAP